MPAQARIWAVLGLNDVQFNRGIRKTERQLKNLASSSRTIGNDLTRYISLPLALAGGASVKFATDFEASMMKIRTLVGIPKEFTDEWGKTIRAMSGDVGRGPNELAEALFFVTSAGIRSAKALDVVRMSAQASVIGLGETKAVARTVVAAMQAWSKSNLTAKDSVDALVATVRYGNVESEELAGSMGRVMGIAAEMGVSFQEVGAFIATYTRVGVDANIATTALRATLSTLLRPGEQAAEVLRILGTNTEELHDSIRKRGLAQTLIDMTGALSGNVVALGQLNPNVRALSGVLAVASSQAAEYLQITKDMTGGTVDAAHEFGIASQTMLHQFNRLKAALEELAITMGEHFMPMVRYFTAMAIGTVKALNNMDAATARSRVNWLLFTAAIGPVLIGVSLLLRVLSPLGFGILRLAKAVYELTKAFIVLRATLSVLGALKVLGAGITAVAVTSAYAAGAVLALGFALVAAFSDSDTLRPWLAHLGKFGEWTDRILVAFKLAGNAFLLFVKVIEIGIRGLIDQTFGTLLRIIGLLPGSMGKAAQEMADVLRARLERAVDRSGHLFSELRRELDDHFAYWAKLSDEQSLEPPFMIARPSDLEQLMIALEHGADLAANMENIFGEGGLFAEAGKGAAKLGAFFAKAKTAAEDAADTTDLDKYNRKVQRGAEALQVLIDKIIKSGNEGRNALKEAARQAGIDFDEYSIFTGGDTAAMALKAVLIKELEKAWEATEEARKKAEAISVGGQFTTVLSGVKTALEDALDVTPAQQLAREIERNNIEITEFHAKLTELGGPGLQALDDLSKRFKMGSASLKDMKQWLADVARDTAALNESATASKGLKSFFKDLNQQLQQATASTLEKFNLKLAAGKLKITELWAALNADDRSALADALGKTSLSLRTLLEEYENTERGIAEANDRISFNLGEMIASPMQEVFTGILRGTREAGDIMKAFTDMSIGMFGKMFSEMIKEKLDFDFGFEKNFMEDLPNILRKSVQKMSEVLGKFFQWALAALQRLGNDMGMDWSALGALGGGKKTVQPPSGFIGPSRDGSSIGLAQGGITRGPQLALVGDNPSGREAIIPLERWKEVMGSGGGGSPTIEIHSPSPLESKQTGTGKEGQALIQLVFQGAKHAVATDIMDGGIVSRSIQAAFSSQRKGGR